MSAGKYDFTIEQGATGEDDIKKGKETVHDDFAPFEAIGKAWGDTHLTGASTACNVWTAIT